MKLRWWFWKWKCWAHRWKVEKSKLLVTFLNELLTVWKNINFQKSYNTFSVARARKKWSWTIWRPSSVRLAQNNTDCFFELERSKYCSNFFDIQCFYKRSKARSERWTRAYVFQLFIDVLNIFIFEIFASTSHPSIKKFEQIIRNNIICEIYAENMQYEHLRSKVLASWRCQVTPPKFLGETDQQEKCCIILVINI